MKLSRPVDHRAQILVIITMIRIVSAQIIVSRIASVMQGMFDLKTENVLNLRLAQHNCYLDIMAKEKCLRRKRREKTK